MVKSLSSLFAFDAGPWTAIAVVLSALAALGTAVNTIINNRSTQKRSEVELIIENWRAQVGMVTDENRDLRQRLTQADERQNETDRVINQLQSELRDCKTARAELGAQLEWMKRVLEKNE